MNKIFISGVITGTITGLLLVLMFAYIQMQSGIPLMDLLLNVDFIYSGPLNIVFEIVLHLIVSIIIAVLLKAVFVYRRSWYLAITVIFFLITVALYFILQAIGYSVTIYDNRIGFTLWTIFHIGYFQLIYYMYKIGY
ncbi:hypothetical protein [Lacicoccus qingdaonensis]|uniref:Uncharacterized protein n=1 Tax=Lacicoccus qingdaonensis TaxID=576118 RepID=A0A1G9BAK7_9BACL|nr:hypothetical protein [Salinicoccus qingdaonensis]SDK36100.1 hypothetical protein SAMN05216216_102168 [Salinicoccus qingdaonensis]